MESIEHILENEILPKVTKPLRYVGNEHNSVKKNWEEVKLRFLFAFPDLYEVGMSHLGLRILYHLVNEKSEYLMERVFAPWTDLEAILRQENIPLFSLESWRPLTDFDCIGFTLQYEMSYTNILNMLDLGKIPLKTKERDETYPLIIAGGPCAGNPEPLAEFIDVFVIGEGEEVILEMLDVIARHHEVFGKNKEKNKLLDTLASLEGLYVPSLHQIMHKEKRIVKRVVKDLDESYFPLKPIVPYMEIVHDRIMLELFRGCTRGCRFCQAGMIYRPVRERSGDVLKEQARQLVKNTGYNEISLTSLSTSDYSGIAELTKSLLDAYEKQQIGLSLPSLRLDSFSVDLAQQVQRVRKTGLTFAPEAGTQRLRDVINKNVTEENLLEVVEAAFYAGWTHLKLYFMIGLPTETMEDIEGIAELAYRVLRRGVEINKEKKRSKQPKITVSVSSFVPKAHTPFQWQAQDSIELLMEKQQYLKKRLKDKRISYNYHEAKLSFLEAVFARGGSELSDVLLAAWKEGCKFDSWTEHFCFDKWLKAFAEAGVDPMKIANEPGDIDTVLPWEHIDYGVSKRYLWEEREKAYGMKTTSDCRYEKCWDCGVCPGLDVKLSIKNKKGGGECGNQN